MLFLQSWGLSCALTYMYNFTLSKIKKEYQAFLLQHQIALGEGIVADTHDSTKVFSSLIIFMLWWYTRYIKSWWRHTIELLNKSFCWQYYVWFFCPILHLCVNLITKKRECMAVVFPSILILLGRLKSSSFYVSDSLTRVFGCFHDHYLAPPEYLVPNS